MSQGTTIQGKTANDQNVPVRVDNEGVVQVQDGALTDGTQKIQIVDSGGEAVSVTDGKLDVNSAAPEGGATEANQAAIIAELQKKVDATEAQLVQQDNYMRVLSQILARPIYFNPATGALKVDSHAVTLSSTNVTTLTNFGTLAADVMARNTSINTWANTARRTIS